MTVQTTYAIDHAEAYVGMRADQQAYNTVSKLNKGAVNIPYGKAIVTDGENGGALPDAGSIAQDFNGVALRELNRAIADGDALGAVPDKDFTVFTHGVIWVTVLDTVVKDAPVYMRIGATGLGDFSGVIGAGVTEGILLPGVKFITGGDNGDLVKISIGVGG
jgi:hypothetical protein